MFEKFLSGDSADFRQRYQGTYGYFTHKGKKTLTRLDTINIGGPLQYVEFSDREGLKYMLHADSENEDTGFEFLPPKSSYYNTKEGVPLLVGRIPARQYLRGICDRNTSITNLRNANVEVGFPSLVKIFEERVTAKEALATALKSGANSNGVAISPSFAVGLNMKTIKCFNQTIGSSEYKDGLFTISLDSPELWGQEVKDAFQRVGIDMVYK